MEPTTQCPSDPSRASVICVAGDDFAASLFGWLWAPVLSGTLRLTEAPPVGEPQELLLVCGEALFAIEPARLAESRVYWLLDSPANFARLTQRHVVAVERIYSLLLPDELGSPAGVSPFDVGGALAKTRFVSLTSGSTDASPFTHTAGREEGHLRAPTFELCYRPLQTPLGDHTGWTTAPRRPWSTNDVMAAAAAAMALAEAPEGWWLVVGAERTISPCRTLWLSAGGGIPIASPTLREGFRTIAHLEREIDEARGLADWAAFVDTDPPAFDHLEMEHFVPQGAGFLSFRLTLAHIARGLRLPAAYGAEKSDARGAGAVPFRSAWLPAMAAPLRAWIERIPDDGARRAARLRCLRGLGRFTRVGDSTSAPRKATPSTDSPLLEALSLWERETHKTEQLADAFLRCHASVPGSELAETSRRLKARSPDGPWLLVAATISALPISQTFAELSPRSAAVVRSALRLLGEEKEGESLFLELVRLWCLAILREAAAFDAAFNRWHGAFGVRYLMSAVDYAVATDLDWQYPDFAYDSEAAAAIPGGGLVLLPAVGYACRGQQASAANCLRFMHERFPSFFMGGGDIFPWNKHLLLHRMLRDRGQDAEAGYALAWARAVDVTCGEQAFLFTRGNTDAARVLPPLPAFLVPWNEEPLRRRLSSTTH